ncbi:hypothetical protein QC823_13390 [Halomonas vilamensis]|uniref:Uncharacterized protein n=1 Tax=Vreelandella vilamensis TaxID=531309 RepID=A0ABU1H788_9GAMM|nr:hypothetical protein [Halomonas vilamensis]MDR5899980.1 hypothetical protein [Halomonas vilamensis]
MQSEATIEARRLSASLRSINANAAESAHTVSLALQSNPNHHTLMGAAAMLETIEQQLPPGTLAALIRVRLVRLQWLVNSLLDNNQLPPVG